MNVLILSYEFPPIGGGGGVIASKLTEKLLQKKDSVLVVTSKFKKLPFVESHKNLKIIRLPVFRKRQDQATIFEMLLYLVLSFFFLFFIRFKYKFDAINIHYAVPTGILSLWVKLLFGKPITLVLHGGDVPNDERPRFEKYYPGLQKIIMLIINYADNVVAVNYEVLRCTRKLTKRKIHVIPNGVDINKFKPTKTKKEYEILFVGRFIPMKNPMLAIEAFYELQKKIPHARMLMIGDGLLYNALYERRKKYGLDKKIEFMGWVDGKDLPKLINKCTIYWSLQKRTNFGSLTLLEALSCGLPVILTNVGKSSEFVSNRDFLVNHNPKKIAIVTEKLLKNHKLLIKSSKESRIIAQSYSIDEMAKKYSSLFDKSI